VASTAGGEGTEGRNGGAVACVAMCNHAGGSGNVQSPEDSPNKDGCDMDVAMDIEPCKESEVVWQGRLRHPVDTEPPCSSTRDHFAST